MPVHLQRKFPEEDAQVGHILSVARHGLQLDLRSVTELTGIDYRVLSRIERGIRPCRVAELITLANGYHIDPVVLMRAITGDSEAIERVYALRPRT